MTGNFIHELILVYYAEHFQSDIRWQCFLWKGTRAEATAHCGVYLSLQKRTKRFDLIINENGKDIVSPLSATMFWFGKAFCLLALKSPGTPCSNLKKQKVPSTIFRVLRNRMGYAFVQYFDFLSDSKMKTDKRAPTPGCIRLRWHRKK